MICNIVLTGFMGTGKTEVGRKLSQLLGMRFVDIDQEIEKSQGRSISEIFEQHGEERFRQLETEAVRQFSAEEGIIIATGGGAVLREENIHALSQKGIIFCLTASPEVILQRTGRNNNRPLLCGQDRQTRVSELLESRKLFYEKAGIMISTDGKTPPQIAEEIIEKVKWIK
jgi:shikimate kinase